MTQKTMLYADAVPFVETVKAFDSVGRVLGSTYDIVPKVNRGIFDTSAFRKGGKGAFELELELVIDGLCDAHIELIVGRNSYRGSREGHNEIKCVGTFDADLGQITWKCDWTKAEPGRGRNAKMQDLRKQINGKSDASIIAIVGHWFSRLPK